MEISNSWKENAFDSLFEHLDCIIIYITTTGIVKAFNKEAEDIYKWKAADVLNKNFFELCHQFNYQVPITNLAFILSGIPCQNVFTTLQTPSGEKKSLKWTLLPLAGKQSDQTHIVMFAFDATSYQQMEDKFAKTTAYLDGIINNLPHFIFWKDRKSNFLGCNRKFAESIGIDDPQNIMGKSDYDMPWSKEQSQLFIDDDRKIMETGIPKLNYEEIQRQIDGYERTMLVSKVPIYHKENNEVTGLLGIYTDITERKKTEIHLREAKEKAELANIAKTEFIRNMEHDIRTPIGGIHGIATLLWEEETNPLKKEYAADVIQASKELLVFCNDIIDFIRTELNTLPILNKKFKLLNVLESVMKIQKPAVKLKNLNFSLEYDENIPDILLGDKYRLQRILINLLSNAIKFTKEGHVKLRVKLVKIVNDRSILLYFYVQDSGIGIAKEKIKFIFEKFTRLQPSNQGLYKGSGLGLKIVKQFVHELEGEIDIESEEGKGTTFICALPFMTSLIHEEFENEIEG